jgi:hypothetical protein
MKTLELFGFCDLDWGGNVDTIMRSTINYVFLLGGTSIIGLAKNNQ